MKVQYRINNVTFGFIAATSGLLDAVGFLLGLTVIGSIVGTFIGIVAGIALWIVFMVHGVKYSGTGGLKKIAATFGTMVAEIIPMVNMLPMITTGAVLVVLQSRLEDKEKAKEDEAKRIELQRQQARIAQQQAVLAKAANDNMARAEAAQAA